MDLNVNVKITLSADAELLTHLATFAGTIQEVLKVSNAQLNEAKPVPTPAITADNIASASVPIVPPPATPVVPTAPATTTAEPEKPKRKPAAKKTVEPKQEEVKSEPVKEQEPAKTVTIEEVRKLCIDVVQADKSKKTALGEAIKACGGEKLSDVPPERLGELAELVRAL